MNLDLRGLECPEPTEQTVATIRQLREDGSTEFLVVETDDAVCAADIPVLAQGLGYRAETMRDKDRWIITLRPSPADARR